MTEPAEEFLIDDMETLQVLVDDTRLEIIELLSEPHSVTELAEAMGVPRTRLYHHVKLLEQIEAIVAVDERRSGAKTEAVYRVAARNFTPSPEFLESASPKDRGAAIIDSLLSVTRADFLRSIDKDLITLDQRAANRSLSLTRRVVKLTPEQATDLVERLEALLSEFDDHDNRDDENASVYGVLTIVHPSSRPSA